MRGMGEPWGISGPWFLVFYAVGFVVAVGTPFAVRRLAARVGPSAWRPDVELDLYRTAFLAKDYRRVGETALAALALRGQILVGRDGRFTAVEGETVDDPIESLAYDVVRGGGSRGAAKWAAGNNASVNAIRDDLVSRHLYVRSGRLRLYRVAALVLPVAVWVTGLVRVIDGAALHRSVAVLFSLLVLTGIGLVIAVYVALDHVYLDSPTDAGRRYLRSLPSSPELLAVAVSGLGAIADPDLRDALGYVPSRTPSAAKGVDNGLDPNWVAGASAESLGDSGGGGGGCGG